VLVWRSPNPSRRPCGYRKSPVGRSSVRKRARMNDPLRRWKCRNCSRANETVVALDGTAKCDHCTKVMSVQPSRVRDGVVLPASYPTRIGTPRGAAKIVRSLGEV
jgi:hypothetical protein